MYKITRMHTTRLKKKQKRRKKNLILNTYSSSAAYRCIALIASGLIEEIDDELMTELN